MKFRILAPALAVAALALISSSAQAGLFSHHGYGGCGYEPACGAPAVTCCDPEPSCCDSGCGHHRRGLFSCFKLRRPHGLFGCHSGCGCAAAEPACGCEVVSEPACGCEAVAEPACGCAAEAACGCEPACAPACDPCARKRCGGLLHRLFSHKHRCGSACGCAVEPSCGYAAEAACGCEPACGCN